MAAWWAGTLTSSGVAAGWAVGTLILHGTGWHGGAVLAAFFVSSNLISRLTPGASIRLDPKGDKRDAWQVFANGGPAALGAALSPTDSLVGLWLVTASLAAAAADTWATTMGMLSRTPPRLVWSGRIVPAGTSGGMTGKGTAFATVGALTVSGAGALVAGLPILLPVGTLIGFLGMVVDSLVGGLLQGRFYCPACDEASEWPVHRCGASNVRKGGLAWLNNDGVNLLSTTLAAVLGWAAWRSFLH